MNLYAFITYIEKIINFQYICVYLCQPEVKLSEEIDALENDCDYTEFLEAANGSTMHLNMYIDHDHENLFDWIEMEEPEPEEPRYEDEDVDSIMADNDRCDHEEDDEVISSKRTFNE
ncbi:unnamed protein product [Lactuca virosa]|uniref:Uncharacterized protein n=1 Tax=Lactuca virosa TaxID=75947 RepID=A0AAU9NG57_9ASTR|nr:unnamed protein product [Lactuca virosa]